MSKEASPVLYLIPVTLSDVAIEEVIPSGNIEIVRRIKYFIVENVREARRFLRRCDRTFPIDECTFYELNTHTDRSSISEWLDPLRAGECMGLMSDAGCPAVADPGSDVVMIAQREGLKVKPLVGPSSILLSLMASGFNGQGFTFNGYIPVDENRRRERVQELERIARRSGQTQIFIEAPYRNNKMLRTLAECLHPATFVCVACEITDSEREDIRTMTAKEWGRLISAGGCDYDKRPTIFLIHVAGSEPVTGRKGVARK